MPSPLPALLLFCCALAPLAAAPAPLPRPARPAKPAAEVVVEVAGDLERIEVTFGARKVSVEADGRWQENLAACLKRFRESAPATRRLILRCDVAEMSPAHYVGLRRTCAAAGYPQVRLEEARPGR